MSNELAKSENKQITIKEYIAAPAVMKRMKEILQSDRSVRQFTTSILAISSQDDLLANAEPRSLFNACLTAASLDLPINKNLGFAHIIGYKNNKKHMIEAQFQIGAKGLKQLAMRTGQYKFINGSDVREGELKNYDRLSGEMSFEWEQDTAKREKLKVIGYVSYFKLHNGFESTVYMTVEEVTAHAKRYSQSFKSGYGPWSDNFEAMAAKTVMKRNIANNGPMTTELQTAVSVDQATINDDGEPDYIDGEEVGEVDQETVGRINDAKTVEELTEISDALDVPTRKSASKYITARFMELNDDKDSSKK